jgi:hypothetical protein
MSIDTVFGNFFKSEIQSSGRDLFAEGKVSIVTGSDTAIQAYVRVLPPAKVKLSTGSVGSPSFVAECSCPTAQKSQFCKHVWATLLGTEERYPDFLSEKREIHKPDDEAREAKAAANPPSARATAAAARQAEFQAASKVRAAEYRKQQYQKQKARAKERKGGRSASALGADSPEIESALAYFKLNGFEMPNGPDEEIVREAKKVLSRVFHPDRGGTNAEVGELNHYCDVVLKAARER